MNPEKPILLQANVRFEQAESDSGYIWGKPLHNSRIMRQLASEEYGVPLWKTSRVNHLRLRETDTISERWICSDDPKFPSMVNTADRQPLPLNSLLEKHGDKLLGYEHLSHFGHFICTVMKILDTNETIHVGSLSVQIHPGYKSKIGSPKPEMWKGEGKVYLGWNRNVDPESIQEAIEKNSLEHYLNRITLTKDLPVIVPAGVVHAIRYDTFLSEWSRAPNASEIEEGLNLSRSTFALYDRTDGRKPRSGKEDFENALAIIKAEGTFLPSTNYRSKTKLVFRDDHGNQKLFLFRTPEIYVEQWEISTAIDWQVLRRGYPFFVERGAVNLIYAGGKTRLRLGDEVFVPAAANTFRFENIGTETAILQAWYPPFPHELQSLRMEQPELAFGAGDVIFTDRDIKRFVSRGVSLGEVKKQLNAIRNGKRHLHLDRPCTVGDGIKVIPDIEKERFLSFYADAAAAGRVMKFVPASGAATRMFGSLGTSEKVFVDTISQTVEENRQLENENHLNEFFTQLSKFPFYEDLACILAQDELDIRLLLAHRNYERILKVLLGPEGLNYSHLPKGLVKFHRYGELSRTAFEEQLVEALQYTLDDNEIGRVHFTLSSGNEEEVRKHIETIRHRYELNGKRLEITFSQQKASTDVIATDLWNNPIRQEDGHLLFRPGGHGALLENLNNLEGDIVIIKNIDNVLPEWKSQDTIIYKKLLCGYLLALQKKLFNYIESLGEDNIGDYLLEEMFNFANVELALIPAREIIQGSKTKQVGYLLEIFNRPLRICGVVTNIGEPGGGPFWTRTPRFPLQIVESSEIDMQDFDQEAIWNTSQYFNPVDIVCGVRNYQGQLFNLFDFSCSESWSISIKLDKGLKIKALELPGLWNGSMAFWNTVFVEVPDTTFGPVKNVFDLLRENHQPKNA